MADSVLSIFYKMNQVISMGGIMWEGLNSSLIKIDEALLKQQIRAEMRNKKREKKKSRKKK
ncbi:unnamed protein product [Arabidopsis thaliana]|uniref:Uncharacterized protein n=1 Tax=Arabidopsis thaliana TaxID=3702 RepID=A0A654EFZ4_ARATH|nr:unnamed protein product [Arabidopsis thaliana]